MIWASAISIIDLGEINSVEIRINLEAKLPYGNMVWNREMLLLVISSTEVFFATFISAESNDTSR